MNLRYENGLLFTNINIEYKGKKMLIENIVLDTGAAHTIIDPDIVTELGIKAEPSDNFITMYGIGGEHYAYRKNIDSISITNNKIENINIDFGIIDEDGFINGLLGLDVLVKLGVNINLKELIIEFK
ncbi:MULTISPECIES: retropepsin-like aspartic protease [unclassified Clostridium]|uniref:retropepsin-like aspartic protease n=1 Tax=unclassified Clostridium TaxID=2614128 RepID=UPI0013F0061C|nr:MULTISPECIES: retropepsin-like aspartic protease [unclassified Clostridium]NFR87133.1 aspartyl protease [Clostridium botulinum]NFR90816.1 aspartyl protease [Clostridium botulinum]NFS30448.1 aspartyl protease [Clostridium botulinum]NFS53803.1 aspartyl protease [Clostridium botulinum]NFT17215.1 aspartyl protease [Clostridium botulinum]